MFVVRSQDDVWTKHGYQMQDVGEATSDCTDEREGLTVEAVDEDSLDGIGLRCEMGWEGGRGNTVWRVEDLGWDGGRAGD